MRRWLLPVVLAVLALPSVVGMVEASIAVLNGQVIGDFVTVVVDLCRGVVTVAVALVVLRLADRPPRTTLWLVDHRVLARGQRRLSDQLTPSTPAGVVP